MEASQQIYHLHWSDWRRHHQWQAQQGHRQRRQGQQAIASADLPLPEPVVIGGLLPLTPSRWEQITSLLPPQRPPTGRPALNHRQILEGMLWIMRMGTSWRHLPRKFGSWKTIYSRFCRWKREGLWEQIRALLLPPP